MSSSALVSVPARCLRPSAAFRSPLSDFCAPHPALSPSPCAHLPTLFRFLLPKNLRHPLHNTVPLGIIRMVLTRNLQQAGKRLRILIHPPPNFLRDVLVDQQDGDILSFGCEIVESGFDGGRVGFGVGDQEVALGVGGVCYVLCRVSEEGGQGVEGGRQGEGGRTPTPASRMPVTVSCCLVVSGCFILGNREVGVGRTSSPITAMNCRPRRSPSHLEI